MKRVAWVACDCLRHLSIETVRHFLYCSDIATDRFRNEGASATARSFEPPLSVASLIAILSMLAKDFSFGGLPAI